MKITGIETFVVDTGFTPRRPWLFSAVRTDAGLTGSAATASRAGSSASCRIWAAA